ncbi:MAG TPA: hypothetical protein VEY95_02530 [Azospirillaceae bacterium]|nr:hypothetical protein [Azospirillaceae bacterium]
MRSAGVHIVLGIVVLATPTATPHAQTTERCTAAAVAYLRAKGVVVGDNIEVQRFRENVGDGFGYNQIWIRQPGQSGSLVVVQMTDPNCTPISWFRRSFHPR